MTPERKKEIERFREATQLFGADKDHKDPTCEALWIETMRQGRRIIDDLENEIELLHAQLHGMQDGALVRDQAAEIERLRLALKAIDGVAGVALKERRE